MAFTNVNRGSSQNVFRGSTIKPLTDLIIDVKVPQSNFRNFIQVLRTDRNIGESFDIKINATPMILQGTTTGVKEMLYRGENMGYRDFPKTGWGYDAVGKLNRISTDIKDDIDYYSNTDTIFYESVAEQANSVKGYLETLVTADFYASYLASGNYGGLTTSLSGEGSAASSCWVKSTGAANKNALIIDMVDIAAQTLINRWGWGKDKMILTVPDHLLGAILRNNQLVSEMSYNKDRHSISLEDAAKAMGIKAIIGATGGYYTSETAARSADINFLFGDYAVLQYAPDAPKDLKAGGNIRMDIPQQFYLIESKSVNYRVQMGQTMDTTGTFRYALIDYGYSIHTQADMNCAYLIQNLQA